MAWWYVLTRQKAHFFYTLLFCSKIDFKCFFFNEIVRVVSSMKECEESELVSSDIVRSSPLTHLTVVGSRTKFLGLQSALARSGSVLWLVYVSYRSFQQTFIVEDCVTSQKNVCVGG